ncbi:MAG TPA: methyltransferase domain-containing protein [Phycisphaerae bacterium]|nr:methyltransferase domain-containing protein [Phycisphaerae bacterium]
MTQKTRQAYDRWAHQYDADPHPHTKLEFDDILALLAPQAGEKILDAGCGTGRYIPALIRAGARVVGIDFSPNMLASARSKNPGVEFRAVDLSSSLPFVDREFDAILCAQVAEHLPVLGPPIKEFFRILKPGGRAVISVTHASMTWEGYELRSPPESILSLQTDIFHHTPGDYFIALDDAGFKIDKILQIPVSEKIRDLLTPQTYEKFQGRFQIMAVRMVKPAVERPAN